MSNQDVIKLYDSGKVSSFDLSAGNWYFQEYDCENMASQRISEHGIPQKYGGYIQTAGYQNKSFSATTTIEASTRTLVKTELRNLKQFLSQNELYFYFSPPGVYIPCEYSNMSVMTSKEWRGLKQDITLSFITDDPFMYYSGDINKIVTGIQSSDRNFDVYNSGAAPCFPLITISGWGGTVTNIKVINNDNDTVWKSSTSLATADKFLIDCTNKTFTENGINKVADMLQSDFIKLDNGNNDIQITNATASGLYNFIVEFFYPKRDW